MTLLPYYLGIAVGSALAMFAGADTAFCGGVITGAGLLFLLSAID